MVCKSIDYVRIFAAPFLYQRKALQSLPFSLEIALVAVLSAGSGEEMRNSKVERIDLQVLCCFFAADDEESVGIGS